MKLPENVTELILNADGKALATVMNGEAHVVPVSTIRIENDKVLLVNYFMGQTLLNIKDNPKVALSCWKGLEGFQIKGEVEYITEGNTFDLVKDWVSEILPDRIVLGVLSITANEIFDISATAPKPGKKIL